MNNRLSQMYPSLIEKFNVRGYIEVSEVTSYGNPKEFKLKFEIEEHILYLPEAQLEIINKAVKENRKHDDDDLPF